MQDLITQEDYPPKTKNLKLRFNFEITSLQEAMEYSKLIADSDLAPKDYRGKPGNVLIAIQFGIEIGLKPLQALQNISVINGRPAIWGDAMIALVQNNPLCEYITEERINDVAYCSVKRKGEELHIAQFSMEDAKKAGLIGKPGPWTSYPHRMLQMRARAFALRDKFSDVLKGLAMREEVEDYQVITAETKTNSESKLQKLISEKSEKSEKAKAVVKELPSNKINEIVMQFSALGISTEQLETRLGHLIEETNEQEIVDLKQFYKQVKNEHKENTEILMREKENDKK